MKNVKISDNTHDVIKQHCDEHGLKISSFVDRLCRKWIDENAKGNNREDKDGSNGQGLST